MSGIKIFFISLESKKGKAFQEPKNIKKLAAEIKEWMIKRVESEIKDSGL